MSQGGLMEQPIYFQLLCNEFIKNLVSLLEHNREFDAEITELLEMGTDRMELSGIAIQSSPLKVLIQKINPETPEAVCAFLKRFAEVVSKDQSANEVGEEISTLGVTSFILPTFTIRYGSTQLSNTRDAHG